MTHAAAAELREHGVHVALLIVNGIIDSPKTAQMTGGMTHELVITPTGGLWLPS